MIPHFFRKSRQSILTVNAADSYDEVVDGKSTTILIVGVKVRPIAVHVPGLTEKLSFAKSMPKSTEKGFTIVFYAL
jgi:hypothetical protein